MASAIWHHNVKGWRTLAPVGFKDEAALHDLVEDAPHVLPLSGAPRLVVVGREVRLGTGYADLVAVEPSGRLVVIEVKLASNAEARRAVVAQILAYAAFLHRLDVDTLERDILGIHLRGRGVDDLAAAVAADAQRPDFSMSDFSEGLIESLRHGRFRLVLVLDSAPDELVSLVGYLESVAPELTIDLVTVAHYEVSGEDLLVPQRIDPEHIREESAPRSKGRSNGLVVDGGEDFLEEAEKQPDAIRLPSRTAYNWARQLEERQLARVRSYHGAGVTTLLIRLPGHDGGFASVWKGKMYLFRSVFEKHAPRALRRVEGVVAPARLGQGTLAPEISPELLEALTAAYEEASE